MKRLLCRFRKASQSSKSSSPRSPNIPADAERQSSSTAALPHETNGSSAPKSETQLNAPLESLPPEVRRHILSITEFEGLKALIHASLVYYQQYLLDRSYILGNSLETTLGPIFIDAYAVSQSGRHDFLKTRNRSAVLQVLDDYKTRRSQSNPPRVNDTLAENEILEIMSFYQIIITPLLQRYASWALDSLAEQARTPRGPDLLSATEKLRIMRALYRFQLFCNLFGLNHCQLPRWERPECEFEAVEMLGFFICLTEPWEVEEIGCVNFFVEEMYNRTFDKIAWDVNGSNPKFEGERPPTPEGAFHLENDDDRMSL